MSPLPLFTIPAVVVSGGAAAVTWNPSDKDASITLSNGNLTATGSTAGYHNVRATIAITTGQKKYWEITVGTNAVPGGSAIGGAASDTALTQWLGGDSTNSFGYWEDAKVYGTVADQSVAAGGWAAGDVSSFALNFTAQLVWVRKNGGGWNAGGGADPATDTGGFSLSELTGDLYAALTLYGATDMTANFGGTAFAYTPPTGFTGF